MSLIGYSYCISAILQGLGSVPDGVDKLKGLIEAVFCFEPIRDKTLSSLLVKFEQWALGVSELSFWLQVVDVWLLVTWGRCRDVDGLLMHKLHVCELLIYFVLMILNLFSACNCVLRCLMISVFLRDTRDRDISHSLFYAVWVFFYILSYTVYAL